MRSNTCAEASYGPTSAGLKARSVGGRRAATSLAATARAVACSTSADTAWRLAVRNRAAMRLPVTARAAWRRGGHDILLRIPRDACLNNLRSSASVADLGVMAEISRETSDCKHTDVPVFSEMVESINVDSPPTVTLPCQKGACNTVFIHSIITVLARGHGVQELNGAEGAEGAEGVC